MDDIVVEKLFVRKIPIYRFHKNTRDAVDQYLALINIAVQEHIEAGHVDEPMGYVIDVSRSGMYSLNYMRSRAKPMVESYEKFPENYIAYVTSNRSDEVVVNMINGITRNELQNTRKVFTESELEHAIDWLLEVSS